MVVECRTAESSNGGNGAEAREHVIRAPLFANRGRALFARPNFGRRLAALFHRCIGSSR